MNTPCDDILEVLVGKRRSRAYDGVGNGHIKCSRNDDISLVGFSTEVFYHRRYQKSKQGIGGIKMAKLRKNRVLFIYGGREGQGNTTIQII